MIITDQEFGVRNYPAEFLAKLPNHEQLLSRGLHLPRYNVHTAPCSPSRSNIFTGLHTQHTRIINNVGFAQPDLDDTIPTLGDMMRAAGYYTCYKGKWHLSSINGERNWNHEYLLRYPNTSDALERYGFSDYDFDGEAPGLTWGGFSTDGALAAEAAKCIFDYARRNKAGGKPWFQVVGFINPHDIMFFDATGHQSETRLAPELVAPVKDAQGDRLFAENLGYDLPESFYKDDLSAKPEAERAIVEFCNQFYGNIPRRDVASWKRFVNYYYNCIRDVDRHIGTILWALKESGQDDNTIIVFTSDHGERAGAHGMRQKGGTVYKEEMNAPLVIVHPDGPRGAVSERLIGAIDLAPTFLSFAGKDRAWTETRFPNLKGIDVSALVADPNAPTERDVRGHLFNDATITNWAAKPPKPGTPYFPMEYDLMKRRALRGVFDGRYKFARFFAPAQHHIPNDWETLVRHNDLELYDTQVDPNEIVNLAYRPDDHRDTILRLNRMLNALIAAEIGHDDGSEYPPPIGQYTTLD